MLNQVDRLVDDLLDRRYERTARDVLGAIGRAVMGGRVAQRLRELDEEAARLAEAGERLRPDNPVLVALLTDLEATLERQAQAMGRTSSTLQNQAVEASGRLTRELALPGIDDGQLAQLGIRWNTPDPEAVNELVGFVNGSAWQQELNRFPRLVVETVRNQAIRGIASGWSPTRAAREARRVAQGLSVSQANNLMRTLYLQSYRRGAAIHQRANSDILTEQIRVGVLDQRTCLACISLHGTRLPVGQVVVDHHQGRCTAIPVVRGRPRDVRTGEQWFNSLSRDEQEGLAPFLRSPGKLEALRSGRAELRDFVQYYDDPVFGLMVREGGLGNALSGGPGGGGVRPPRRGPEPTGGLILTGDGWEVDDDPGFDDITSLAQLDEYVNSDGLRARYMWDTDALGFNAAGRVTVDEDVLYEHIKRYVRDSRSSFESRTGLQSIMRSYLRETWNENVTMQDADAIINQDEARRADALLKLAEVTGLRLTEPQRRRLGRAQDGEYLDVIFQEVGETGTFENALRRAKERSSGIRRDSAEYRRMKDDFDRIMGRGDYR